MFEGECLGLKFTAMVEVAFKVSPETGIARAEVKYRVTRPLSRQWDSLAFPRQFHDTRHTFGVRNEIDTSRTVVIEQMLKQVIISFKTIV